MNGTNGNGNGAHGARERWETLARLYAGGSASTDELDRLAILLEDTYHAGIREGAIQVFAEQRSESASLRSDSLKVVGAMFSDYLKKRDE